MSDLPTGEVTFLFTDVESSTALWEREPEAMAAAVAEHDELLHRTVEANGGVVFKGLGDGVCAVFVSAGDGVAAARECQHRLLSHAWPTSEPLRVRMAVHTGVAQLRGGDYFGTALNRTARLMGTAHGGQVVLTQAAALLVEDELRPGTSLLDLGMHRLKDLRRPEHVFQLQHPGLPVEFPSLRSLDLHRGNLPHRVTEFIGRDDEIAQVGELVATHRLVTLRGTGGIGKTSLAIRAAAEIIGGFSGGVWLVELAPLTDGDQIPGAAAALFGVEASASQDVTEVLTRHLAGMETLLVLDNCEHVIDGAAEFVDTLLGATERVKVLATSREVLRIGGEAVFRVPSLRLPVVDSDLGGIVDAEAVVLFVDRAQLVRQGFAVDDTNAAAVIEICRRLDGIPLAIELAAARLDTMTVAQVAECLDDRFRILTRGSRVAMPRQRTLEALVDWSCDLLSASEQIVLRRLGVFGGNFTLEAVEQVCGFGPLEPPMIAELLDRLTETSLVMPPESPSARYHMLETIRAYSRSHLDRHGETEETMRRLAKYLLEQGPSTRKGRPEGDLVEWLRWRADEQDNYRATLNWTREEGDGQLLGALAVDFLRYLIEFSLAGEADAWAASALDALGEDPSPLRLQCLRRLGLSAGSAGDMSRERILMQAYRSEAEALGDDAAVAEGRVSEAYIIFREGDLYSALPVLAEATEQFTPATDVLTCENSVIVGTEILSALGRYDEAEALVDRFDSERGSLRGQLLGDHRISFFRGVIAIYRGEYDRAVDLIRSCVEPAKEVSPFEHGGILVAWGWAEFGRDNYTVAHELLREGLSLLPDNAASDEAWVQIILALINLESEGLRAAGPYLRGALDASRGVVIDREQVLTTIGEAALAVGEAGEAAVFHSAAVAARERIPGLVPYHWTQSRHERTMEHLEQTLQPEDLQRLINEGRSLSYEEAAERAQTFLDRALDMT